MTWPGLKTFLAAMGLIWIVIIVVPVIAFFHNLWDWLKGRFKK